MRIGSAGGEEVESEYLSLLLLGPLKSGLPGDEIRFCGLVRVYPVVFVFVFRSNSCLSCFDPLG